MLENQIQILTVQESCHLFTKTLGTGFRVLGFRGSGLEFVDTARCRKSS